ncbi:TPA: amidohydrolase [Campylobacter jejuni]|nr:amidohydrolase [Campylobacter jejuni]HDZ4941097.1 amidohydrolase [Campylobacter jejuni]HDZ4943829.1 amidohydrolase [Campylobacter jejuni]HDZ4953475.1 amidohydrolase [Campylobacter jejuni]HDZ4965196.1 amidohydrolase [Campylobacter jejuni]
MKIDTHAHIFLKKLNTVTNARYKPSYDASFKDYKANLHDYGFDKGVLVQPSFLGVDNEFLLQSIKKDENIKAIVVVDENIKFEELKKLKERKACGIRLNLIGKELPNFENIVWVRFFENLSKLKMQIEIQRDLDNDLVSIIENLLPYNCNIVIDHLARANADLTNLEDLIRLKNSRIFFKISGFYRSKIDYINNEQAIKFAKKVYEILKEHFLLSNFIFGSDWPHTNFEKNVNFLSALEAFNEIVISKKEQEQILGDNACALFDF